MLQSHTWIVIHTLCSITCYTVERLMHFMDVLCTGCLPRAYFTHCVYISLTTGIIDTM